MRGPEQRPPEWVAMAVAGLAAKAHRGELLHARFFRLHSWLGGLCDQREDPQRLSCNSACAAGRGRPECLDRCPPGLLSVAWGRAYVCVLIVARSRHYGGG